MTAAVTPPVPFIVGVPRSGTTLLRLMLDAHPEVAIPPESFFVPLVARLTDAESSVLRQRFFDAVVGCRVWPDFHIEAAAFRAALDRLEPFDVGAGIRCFYHTYAARFGKQRWGDKTPGYNTMMTVIEAVVPEVHFIHVLRDGRDVALSHRHANFWWAAEGVRDHARYWRDTVCEARRQGRVCRHFLEIRYEDLVRDTTATLRRICEFLHLPYDPRMERFHDFSAARLDELADLQRRDGSIVKPRAARLALFQWTLRPPDESRIGQWRTRMSRDEVRAYDEIAGPLLRELEYAVGASEPTNPVIDT